MVVSEETGTISLAIDGRLRRYLSPARLREQLTYYLSEGARDEGSDQAGLVVFEPTQSVLAPLSLLLAVIFWLLAAGDGNFTSTERIVSLDVAIYNLPADQIIVDPPGAVTLRLSGLSPFINRSGEAVTAFVDLEGGRWETELSGGSGYALRD